MSIGPLYQLSYGPVSFVTIGYRTAGFGSRCVDERGLFPYRSLVFPENDMVDRSRAIRIEILVPAQGDIVVRAFRNDVPVLGTLGPFVAALCGLSLPIGHFVVCVDANGGPSAVEVLSCDADAVETTRTSLEGISVCLESLALRPSIA